MSPPSIIEFGWEGNEGQVDIRWMSIPAAPDGILENVNCGCRSGCSTKRCACQKAELKCIGPCSCWNCTSSPDQNTDENDLSEWWWRWWWPVIRTWWRWHWIRWAIWRTMMVMHVGIICEVQYISIYLLIRNSHSDPQYLYYKHVYPSHAR